MNYSTESEFILMFSLLNSKIAKRIDSQLSYHGISFTEYMIMHNLHKASKQTMRRIELAEKVGISASGVTRLLAPMEKNGITEKEINPRDARMSLVKLSKTGERLYKESSVSFEHSAKAVTEKLNPGELNELFTLSSLLL